MGDVLVVLWDRIGQAVMAVGLYAALGAMAVGAAIQQYEKLRGIERDRYGREIRRR